MKKKIVFFFLYLVPFTMPLVGQESSEFNATPFGSVRVWNNEHPATGKLTTYAAFGGLQTQDTINIGLLWWEPRDIQRLEVVYGKVAEAMSLKPEVQYWQETWPNEPPNMPVVEDVDDDPWKGKWITAMTEERITGGTVNYTFKALTTEENKNADFLPGNVRYRRTLKIRLVYKRAPASVKAINAYSMATVTERDIRIVLGVRRDQQAWVTGSVEVFNGQLKQFRGWKWGKGDRKAGRTGFQLKLNNEAKGIEARIAMARELLSGSNDETVVTLRTSAGTFSFSMDDLEKGPIYIPFYNAYITKASDTTTFQKLAQGKTVLERIPEQPEQTYERARKEIPPLDPWKSQYGSRMYMPLATDGNWQKFGIEWGGDFFLNKQQTKAEGKELARCNWPRTVLAWSFGGGENPDFDRDSNDLQMSFMNDYIPIIHAQWRKDSLVYEQEFVSTMLHGPLSPFDPLRDEQTPAILLVKVKVSNPSNKPKNANVWLRPNDAVNKLANEGPLLTDIIDGKEYIRAYAHGGDGEIAVQSTDGAAMVKAAMHIGPNTSKTVYFYFPFVGDLTKKDGDAMAALDFEKEKSRVADYWRDIVQPYVMYNVPERKFNDMAKAVIPHIRISATKDPKSGLFMVPASSIGYGVYANESCYQTFLLDRMGDFETSAAYLHTFVDRQGSRKLPGAFIGDQKEVYYGVRVDSLHDQTWVGYNMHHGVTLWALARHYLHARDNDWLKRNAESMKRAADWIIEQRNYNKVEENGRKVPHYGLLPAGVLEDALDWQHWYATNAYAYAGMNAMANAFKQCGMPEADYYGQEAKAFFDDLRSSVLRASELSPVVRLRNGTYVPFVPVHPHQRFRYFGSKKAAYYDRYNRNISPNMRLSATRELLYGPLVLIKTGIVSPDEPMAQWILNDWEDNLTLSTSLNLNTHGWVNDEYWFSRGGMVFQANLQNPVPIYLKQGNAPAAIRGLYNNFVSCLYPEVNVFTEEYRMWGHGSGPFYKVPDEARAIQVISEMLVLEHGNELHLAVGTPRRWLEPGQRIELYKAYTEFGPVSYVMQAGNTAHTIEASVNLAEVTCPSVKLFVRSPGGEPIQRVAVDGQPWNQWDAETESITLPVGRALKVLVSYGNE